MIYFPFVFNLTHSFFFNLIDSLKRQCTILKVLFFCKFVSSFDEFMFDFVKVSWLACDFKMNLTFIDELFC